MPTGPSSAATVSGVVCDGLARMPCFFPSLWLASASPPIPTPAIGCAATTRAVLTTRSERPLVTSRSEWFHANTATTTVTATAAIAAAPIRIWRARGVGGEQAHDEHRHEEREHARLRVRDEEPSPDESDQRDRDG